MVRAVASSSGSEFRGPEDANVRLNLLGGFRAETTVVVPEAAWQQRRSSKQLVKLMATLPGHSLHREQVLDLLWPEVEFSSAVNSFGKALHVARRALEPNMPSRSGSSYLRLVDDVLTLVTDRVWIDADYFRAAADAALRSGSEAALEAALQLYRGELLPEDTYESWATQIRGQLADLHMRILLALADVSERTGNRDCAIERLNQVLHLDAAREDIHRRLMKMHAESGRRLLALRQYQLCCDALERELDAEPESETVALYEDIRADRITREERAVSSSIQIAVDTQALPAAIQQLPSTPLVGRDAVLHSLVDDFLAADGGQGRTVMVQGETGIGKSRLVAEAARSAGQRGALVLWGAGHDKENPLPYGPFLQALEAYTATCDLSEREDLAGRYPELAGHLPSLALGTDETRALVSPRAEQGRIFAAIVRMLTDLAAQRTVVLVLDDIHTASWETVRLLHHIAHLARSRRWLLLGSYREDDVSASSGLDEVLSALIRQGFCRQILLGRLRREDCDTLVRELVRAGAPSRELLEYVHAMTLGNPLFVTELLGALQGRGQLVLKEGICHLTSLAPEGVPLRVRKLVELAMRQMDQRSQQVLALLAVTRTRLSFEQVHTAVREVMESIIPAAKLLDILDAALRSQILEEQEDGYAFAHPLFRAALYDQLSHQRRARYQRAITQVIAEVGDSTSEGDRFSGKTEMETTVAYLERAATRAQLEGASVEQEVHLWNLLEGLHVLGRKEEAERVRQQLRTLFQDAAPYGTRGRFEGFGQAAHEIA